MEAKRTKHPHQTKQSSSKQAETRTEKHGLFLLASPKKTLSNVIAVHGLGGDASTTWTDKHGHMWLQDALPNDLPNSKIWTYGYDSAIAWSNSVSGITDFARDLLARLASILVSAEGTECPLIFICHSLGGIVLKKALVLASLLPHYKLILHQIQAIIFLGTPHRGSRLSSYLTPLSRIVNLLIPTSPIRSDLVGNLQVLSRSLSEISETSVEPLSKISVISCYEQKRMKGVNSLVVEPASAILGIVNERAIPINADHRNMVRFSYHEPEKYRPLQSAIKGLVDKIEEDKLHVPKAFEYAQRLYCVDYEVLLAESIQPFAGTGTWLFRNQTFRAWARKSSSSICWLYGAAGFGKTVIARSTIENAKLRTDRILDLAPFGTSHVLHYFFRDEKIETLSEVSFLRSVLHQLLLENPQAWSVIDFSRMKSKSNVVVGQQQKEFVFATEWLWDALEDVFRLRSSEQALLVLDALDELDPLQLSSIATHLVAMVQSLNVDQKAQQIKILVFSRPNYALGKAFATKEVQSLEVGPQQTASDLQTFVSTLVSEYGQDNSFPTSLVSKIIDRILDGADGMFLWAHLAWEHFKEGIRVWNRTKIESQLKSLGQLPRGLERLYRKLIMSIDASTRAELRPAFILICAAARPLRSDELAEIIAIESWHQKASHIDVPFGLENALLKSCPNLFKIDWNGTLSFAHLSLKDFLLKEFLQMDSKVIHLYLAQRCLRFVSFKDFKEDAKEDLSQDDKNDCLLRQRYTLYDYCSSYLKYHMEQVPRTEPLWIKYSQIVRDQYVFHAIVLSHRRHAGLGERPYFLAETPLRHILRIEALELVPIFVGAGYDIDEKVLSYSGTDVTALHKYIRERPITSLLLNLGANPNAKDNLDRTALHLATYHNQSELISELLAHPHIDVNAEDASGETPLHYQVYSGGLPTLLFDRRVDVSKANKNGLTPMASSAAWGDEKIFRSFVDSPGFNIEQHNGTLSPLICAAQQQWHDLTLHLVSKIPNANSHRGLDGKSIIHWAAINEWEDVLQAAVTLANAKVNAMDHSGKTGLHFAAQLGLYKIARILVRYGASARIQDVFGRTPVHTAAVEGFADTLRPLILDSDFDPQDADKQNRSLIHWAASCDWRDLMTTVLEIPSIDPKKRDHHGRTALHVAALCGCPNIIQVLIEHGIFEAAETDAFGNTALHLASRAQSLTTVEILLPYFDLHKGRLNRWGQTALDVAVIYEAQEAEQFLVRAGLRYQATSGPRSRQLSRSAIDPDPEEVYDLTPDHMSLVVYKRKESPRRSSSIAMRSCTFH